MEAFEEFDRPHAPARTVSSIISHAFETYKGVFIYAIAIIVMLTVASFLLQAVSGFNSNLLSEEIQNAGGDFSAVNFWNMPGIGLMYGLSGLLSLLATPLYVGLIYMANKFNYKQPIQFSDLFIGYRQNTLNIILYGLISNIIIGISFALCVLPGLFVMPLLFLGYPILLFENAGFSEALSKSFRIAKENYAIFLGAALLAALISIAGVFLCVIGLVATYLFYLVAMYSAYCAFCGAPRPLAAAEIK